MSKSVELFGFIPQKAYMMAVSYLLRTAIAHDVTITNNVIHFTSTWMHQDVNPIMQAAIAECGEDSVTAVCQHVKHIDGGWFYTYSIHGLQTTAKGKKS